MKNPSACRELNQCCPDYSQILEWGDRNKMRGEEDMLVSRKYGEHKEARRKRGRSWKEQGKNKRDKHMKDEEY
jgi:hypothetical protein